MRAAFQHDDLIVDSFAGGGGASTGIEMATGRSPDIAINHDVEALAMHAANHPGTLHLSKNVWHVDPMDVVGHRPVGLLWASPDCKHFSKAKGAAPVKRNIRDLAWVVVLWAKRARPRVIILENVEEFREWGPVLENNKPCPERKGETFQRWASELRRLGYRIEWRELRACDYGTPTIRKRLFVIARCDGRPIVWPEPTHGPAGNTKGLLPYRTAAEIIDWSLPCPSIFLSREEGRAIGVKRPLAEATMARIAKGVQRYVLNCADPFVVRVDQTSGDPARKGVWPVDEPVRTLHTRPSHALVQPFITKFRRDGAGAPITDPLATVTANSFHKRPAGAPTMGLVAPILAGCGGRASQSPPYAPDRPMNTITAKADQILIAPTLVQTGYGERQGQEPRALDLGKPLGTVVAGGAKHALVAAFLAQHNLGVVGHDAREPLSTVTQTGSQQAVVSAGLINMHGADRRMSGVDEPAPTITAGGFHQAEVRAFLMKFYREGGQWQGCDEPLHTVTTKGRLGLVMVHGEPYEIVDIGMRMLSPRELFRAQGFPDSYDIETGPDGTRLTKTAQIRMCGNSVCPPLAEALVAANYVGAGAEAEVAA